MNNPTMESKDSASHQRGRQITGTRPSARGHHPENCGVNLERLAVAVDEARDGTCTAGYVAPRQNLSW